MSGLVGTLVGGSATVGTSWVTQRTFNRRELIRVEMSKRETLYGEFIGECSRLLVDALTHTLEQARDLAARLRAAQPDPAVRFASGPRRRRTAAEAHHRPVLLATT